MIGLNPYNVVPFDYQVVACDGEHATIQVQVPINFASTLPSLLSSLQSTLSLMTQRVRVANAVARATDPVEIEKRKEQARQRESLILSRFDKCRAAGASDREAIRQTRDYFRSNGYEITSFVVEIVARDNGRFRKSKHKNKNDLIITQSRQNEKSTKIKSL